MLRTTGIRIGNLPLAMVCGLDGEEALLSIHRMTGFKGIIDVNTEDEFKAAFDAEGFTINGVMFDYETMYPYKEMPELLGWLKQQKL